MRSYILSINRFWRCTSIFRYGSFWVVFIIDHLRVLMLVSTLKHIFKSTRTILSAVGSSTSDFFLIFLSAHQSYMRRLLRFRMIPYSIRRCKRWAQFNHSSAVLHVWTLSIIWYDEFPGVASKSFREHLPLYGYLNRKIVDANVVRAARNLALPSNSCPGLMRLSNWIIYWLPLRIVSLIVDGWLGRIYLNIYKR